MSLAEVYRTLWRHRLALVAGTCLVAAAAWYGISHLPRTYSASALVRVSEQAKDPGEAVSSLQAGETLALTYSTIVASGALTPDVKRLLRAERVSGRVATVRLSSSTVQNLDLFWVTASSRSAATAAAAANAVPAALLQSTAGPSDANAFGALVVVKPAAVPRNPTAPHTTIDLALAVALGLAFNAALILVAVLLGDRLPPVSELERAFGPPVLGSIPTVALTAWPADDGDRRASGRETLPAALGERRA
jgi:tyrosine-protein kinase